MKTPATAVIAESIVSAEPGDAGSRLDRFLAARMPTLSRNRLKGLIEAGHVTVAGTPVTNPAARVKRGQSFAIFVPQAREAAPAPQPIPLDIVYEDESLVVVNKPAGLVVHPAPGNEDRTLVNALLAHCGASLSGIGGVKRPGIVHRLDKDTSGLMVAAKTDSAHRRLSADFAAHRVDRAYQAVVWGVPSPRQGEVTGNIGRHPVERQRMAVVSRGGKPALTRYRVLRALGTAASLVECRLATGRTHQIRVHMAAIGHPVVGDPTYGRITPARRARLSADGREALVRIRRQALHAFRLGFAHPETGEPMRWETGLPDDMKALVEAL